MAVDIDSHIEKLHPTVADRSEDQGRRGPTVPRPPQVPQPDRLLRPHLRPLPRQLQASMRRRRSPRLQKPCQPRTARRLTRASLTTRRRLTPCAQQKQLATRMLRWAVLRRTINLTRPSLRLQVAVAVEWRRVPLRALALETWSLAALDVAHCYTYFPWLRSGRALWAPVVDLRREDFYCIHMHERHESSMAIFRDRCWISAGMCGVERYSTSRATWRPCPAVFWLPMCRTREVLNATRHELNFLELEFIDSTLARLHNHVTVRRVCIA